MSNDLAKVMWYGLLRVWSFFRIFSLFLDYCLGRSSQCMWLVPCMRQLMLTWGPAPDPKCKLNETFLTLPHPLHCPIYAQDISMLLQRIAEWLIYGNVWWRDKGWVSNFFYFFCFSCAFVNCSFINGTW